MLEAKAFYSPQQSWGLISLKHAKEKVNTQISVAQYRKIESGKFNMNAQRKNELQKIQISVVR